MGTALLRRLFRRRARGQAAPTVPEDPLHAADHARDARRWEEAARHYEAALRLMPQRADLWVQLGHALKETGRVAEAEGAYRRALRLQPVNADTHLQLGHALKLQGDPSGAAECYARALATDTANRAALQELLALGAAETARRILGDGPGLLHELHGMLAALRHTVAEMESRLPAAAAVASFSAEHYGQFRAMFRLPAPPPAVPGTGTPGLLVAVLADGAAPGAAEATLASLARQQGAPARLERILVQAQGGPGTVSPAEFRQRLLLPHLQPGATWLVLLRAGTVLDPHALAWFAAAARETGAEAIYADEDHLTEGGARTRPVLRQAWDDLFGPRMLAGLSSLALRLDAMTPPRLRALLEDRHGGLGALVALVRRAGGCAAHLPRVLASRPVGWAAEAPAPPSPALPAAARERIAVVIPTRDALELLKPCMESLRRRAAAPELLDILVLDNGSEQAFTRAWLGAQAENGTLRVLRDHRPFNWSRLNNIGAAATEARLLLFLNNDVEIWTEAWDDTLRAALAEPGTGAVGARLVYPDRTLQHAGIALGFDGRSEHEGVREPMEASGPLGRWQNPRSVAALTGAFLACTREAFLRAGGFDEGLPVWFNDVDFCLRLRATGRHLRYEPALLALHHESPTLRQLRLPDGAWEKARQRMERIWGPAFREDPGMNPHWSRWGRPFAMLIEPSEAEVMAHLRRSALPDPWAVFMHGERTGGRRAAAQPEAQRRTALA